MRYPRAIVRTAFAAAFAVSLLSLAGCSNAPLVSASTSKAAENERRQQMESTRAEMELIPLPSKARYLAVKSLTTWQNPYLTIQGNMVTLHVTLADANPSQFGAGGLLRPVGARQQSLNVRTADLPSALNAIPPTAWPYGRVVAVEEAHDAPSSARPELRRNMETAMRTLSDLGLVVYEWQEGGVALR